MRELWLTLLKALLAATALLLVTFVFLRGRGLTQKYAAHPHPFWSKQIKGVISPDASAPLAAQIQDIVRRGADFVIHLPLYIDETKRLWVIPTPQAKKLIYFQSGSVTAQSLKQDHEGLLLPFAELVPLTQDQRLLLDVRSNVPNADQIVIESIEQWGLSERSIVHSEFDVVLTNLRSQRPKWLFGIPLGERTRASILASLFLEPMARFSGDVLVYFSPEQPENLRIVNPRLIDELHRRHKYVLLGPHRTGNGRIVPATSDAQITFWSLIDAL